MRIRRTAALALVTLLAAGAAGAQTPSPAAPAPQAPAPNPPNAETPPNGVARGVIPPPHSVDPAIVTPPPADLKPSMPVIKPPGAAR